MAKKGHKAASRQAQLRHRRKRDGGRAQVFDAGPRETGAPAVANEPSAGEEDVGQLQATSNQSVRRQVTSDSSRSTSSIVDRPVPGRRSAMEPVSASRFLGNELRRIGIITSLIGVVLAVLTVLLR